MLTKYAFIQNNKITKFRDGDSNDRILIPKLTAHGYLPVQETIQPDYDPATQMVALSYSIGAANVTQVRTVIERLFSEAVVAKKYDIEMKAVSSIQSFFDATDQSTKVASVLTVKDTAIAAVKAAKTNPELRAIKPIYPTVTAVPIGEEL